jgi:hypothetical protein
MNEQELRDLWPNDRTEGCLAGCAILAVLMLMAVVPVGLALLFLGISGTR